MRCDGDAAGIMCGSGALHSNPTCKIGYTFTQPDRRAALATGMRANGWTQREAEERRVRTWRACKG